MLTGLKMSFLSLKGTGENKIICWINYKGTLGNSKYQNLENTCKSED